MKISNPRLETIINELVALHTHPTGFDHAGFSHALIQKIETEEKVIESSAELFYEMYKKHMLYPICK